MKSSKTVRALVESAMMIALATVLSIFKMIDLPYGGSVTFASMLPMIILAYRHGTLWGLGSGLTYAAIQQLLGLNTLSYVTGWQSVVAVILLDYVAAFTIVGFGGIFRKSSKSQRGALIWGASLASALRYVCHVISGATVWAGLSIPSSAALIYSVGYNATYMIPETIILVAVTYYLGGIIDFSRPVPTRTSSGQLTQRESPLRLLSGAIFLLGGVIDVWLIAPTLQDEESGKFIFEGLINANWMAVAIVSVITATFGVALLLIAKRSKQKAQQ